MFLVAIWYYGYRSYSAGLFHAPRLLRFDEWCMNRATGKKPNLCFVEIVTGLYPSTGIPHEHILSHSLKLNYVTVYRELLE